MKKKFIFGLVCMLLVGFVIYGCGKVVKEERAVESGTLIGQVKDIYGNPLFDVTVSVTGVTSAVTSNFDGYFSFLSVPVTDRATVSFSKSGYVSTYRVTAISSGIINYVETNMAQASAIQTLDAGNGGIVSDPNNSSATVTITGGTLRDGSGSVVTGDVDIGINAFDPTDVSQRMVFPGNFAGVVGNEEEPFKSFGFMDVSVEQNGQPLSIGSTAQIEIPIPASQIGSAPPTIDAWYFDPDQGSWIQDGTFTKVSTNGAFVYRKDVSHFSSWNADYLYEQAYVRGMVVDEETNPVGGATVIAEGEGWRNEILTDDDGNYILPVEPGVAISVWARLGTQVSVATPETAPLVNVTKDISDLVLAAPLASMTLVWGAIPSDLDSHLTGPTPEGSAERFHVYWSNKAPLNAYAELDIDYTNGYGPEHVIITKFMEGVYRYAVHNFSGDGSIPTSNAQVRLDIKKAGIINQIYTPPSGQTPTQDVWRVFDLIVDSSGNVTVQVLNDYASSSDERNAYLTSFGASAKALSKKKK